MIIILVYDVNRKRVNKVLRICRKYLIRVQNSVFEGYITESQLNKLKFELQQVINPHNDSIYIYQIYRNIKKEVIGIFNYNDKFM